MQRLEAAVEDRTAELIAEAKGAAVVPAVLGMPKDELRRQAANAKRAPIPDEYVFMGMAKNGPSPLNSAISSSFSSICSRVRPATIPLRRMFSSPVADGSKPILRSRSDTTLPSVRI